MKAVLIFNGEKNQIIETVSEKQAFTIAYFMNADCIIFIDYDGEFDHYDKEQISEYVPD